jgi:hypothetical protein
MAHQFHPFAARAISLASRIDDHIFVALNFEQVLSGTLLLLVNALKLERIKPNAPATTLANVHLEVANLPPGQFIVASWAFHNHSPSFYFAANAASSAAVTSGDSGAAFESKRLMIFPSRPIRNLLKFHLISPG